MVLVLVGSGQGPEDLSHPVSSGVPYFSDSYSANLPDMFHRKDLAHRLERSQAGFVSLKWFAGCSSRGDARAERTGPGLFGSNAVES